MTTTKELMNYLEKDSFIPFDIMIYEKFEIYKTFAASTAHIKNMNCSEGLSLLVIFAASNGCDYIDLDSDGPIYDGFPTYNW